MPKLHYFPGSYWSRVVHLCLRECGIDFDPAFVDIRRNANFDPEYLRLNPRGVVPTFENGDRVICDSRAIVRYLHESQAPTSQVDLLGEAGEAFAQPLHDLPVMLFSYSVWVQGKRGERSADILNDKVERARDYASKYPKFADAYLRKAEFFREFREKVYRAGEVEAELVRARQLLDRLEAHLDTHPFVGGSAYHFADAITTSALYRFVDLGLLDGWSRSKGALASYFARMQARASFAPVFVDDPFYKR
jgi:glutathione S-transferase